MTTKKVELFLFMQMPQVVISTMPWSVIMPLTNVL